VWNPECDIYDQVPQTCEDMGLSKSDLLQLTDDYNANMDALRNAMLAAGTFSWQMLRTGGASNSMGSTCTMPLVQHATCAQDLRSLCSNTSPAQTRALMYAFSPGGCNGNSSQLAEFRQDLANFLLTRGQCAWLGHDWLGCSRSYSFPAELNVNYGEPAKLCSETSAGSGVFRREWSKATVEMDCNSWTPTIIMKV
jgi:hypothetical protein